LVILLTHSSAVFSSYGSVCRCNALSRANYRLPPL
jgi:hypothetical protein